MGFEKTSHELWRSTAAHGKEVKMLLCRVRANVPPLLDTCPAQDDGRHPSVAAKVALTLFSSSARFFRHSVMTRGGTQKSHGGSRRQYGISRPHQNRDKSPWGQGLVLATTGRTTQNTLAEEGLKLHSTQVECERQVQRGRDWSRMRHGSGVSQCHSFLSNASIQRVKGPDR